MKKKEKKEPKKMDPKEIEKYAVGVLGSVSLLLFYGWIFIWLLSTELLLKYVPEEAILTEKAPDISDLILRMPPIGFLLMVLIRILFPKNDFGKMLMALYLISLAFVFLIMSLIFGSAINLLS